MYDRATLKSTLIWCTQKV